MAGVWRLRSEADLLRKEGVNLNGTEKAKRNSLHSSGTLLIYIFHAFLYSLGEGIGDIDLAWRLGRDLWPVFHLQPSGEGRRGFQCRGRRQCHRPCQLDPDQDSLGARTVRQTGIVCTFSLAVHFSNPSTVSKLTLHCIALLNTFSDLRFFYWETVKVMI